MSAPKGTTMEAFALMREELKAERRIKADLLAALVDLVEQGPCLHSAHDAACGVCCARAAIAKAVKP